LMEVIMNHETIRKVLLITAAVVLLSPGVRAQTVDIPYQGWLTLGDQPCNGSHSMVFSLYDTATAGTPVWSNTDSVDVSNGAFSVVLPVSEAVVLGYEDLYLEIGVNGTALVNRQRIYPAMYALRNVPGIPELYVKASANSGLGIMDGWQNYVSPGSTLRSGIFNDTDNTSTVGPALVIVGNRVANSGGNAKVTVLHDLRVYSQLLTGSDATINGNLSVGGDASVNNLQVGGGTVFTRMEAGVQGDCSVDNGVSSAGTITFSTPFSSPPLVFLQPRVASIGCTSARIRSVTTNAFEYRAWVGDVSADCSCIYWLAIGR
jgi:hypothetical protein